jgi:O-antigen/teichoic acid export membrane protein
MVVAQIFRSSSLRAAIGFGIGGAAFAVGNLLLARVMPVAEYGRYALAVAVFNVFGMMAPLGFDEASLRRNALLDGSVFIRIALSGGAVGLIAAAVTAVLYQLDMTMQGLIVASLIAVAMVFSASAILRREGHQTAALAVNNAANWTVVGSGLLCLLLGIHSANFAMTLLMIGVAVGACAGWLHALRIQRRLGAPNQPVPLREALSFVSILGASAVVLQLERLVAPKVLGVEALASFSVLASVALFPYRMLRSGVGFSLVPRLRRARTAEERNRVILHEIGAVVAVLVVASAAVTLLSPPLTDILTKGKYQLSFFLVAAACVNGSAKVITGLPRAFITACGTSADVRGLNWQSWLMIVFGVAGAWFGARWDLAGLVLGAGLGTLAGAAPSIMLAYRVLRRPPVEAPVPSFVA